MRLNIEEITDKTKALIIAHKTSPGVDLYKSLLTKHHFDLFVSTKVPLRFDHFEFIFIFNENRLETFPKLLDSKKHPPIFIIFFNNRRLFQQLNNHIAQNKHAQVKTINIDEESISTETVEKTLWFLLSKSSETSLNLEPTIKKEPPKILNLKKFSFKLSKKRIFLLFVLFFFIFELFFILPLTVTSLFIYKSATALKRLDIEKSQNYLQYSQPFMKITKSSYALSRPFLSFLYLAIVPDDIISLEENAHSLLDTSISTAQNTKQLMRLMINKNKSVQEKAETKYRLNSFKEQLDTLDKDITLVSQKLNYPFGGIKSLKDDLIKGQSGIRQLSSLLTKADAILGAEKERHYLLLFENNMEIRPGGGFIGSYGIATFKDYTLQDLTVEDVYNADGQLVGHVDPPEPIRLYLHQPHWFLRDSNFSPDFPENFYKAEFFLKQELSVPNFDGGIAITTTAINNILGAFGDIYLPDYKETINKDNFYIKTQTQVEHDFFAGSSQKKQYLSSLTKMLFLKLEDASYKDLFEAIKKSLDEKQIVIFFKDASIQEPVDAAGWSGKLLTPQCAIQVDNCILDSFYTVDANLGVNKANFFINRFLDLTTRIDDEGFIHKKATLLFHNDSSFEVFPGGTYKNYVQMYIPSDSDITLLTKNGVKVEEYDNSNVGAFKIIGSYFEVPPKEDVTIEISYVLKKKIAKGKGGYQLVVQKQTGSSNNDLRLTFLFPDNISLVDNNFQGLANDRELVYNTNLSTDKIFFIELIKE